MYHLFVLIIGSLSFLSIVFSFRGALTSPSRVGGQAFRISATGKEIIVVKPTESQIKECKSWPVWGCGVSKFPWSYGERETALLIKGKCIVTPDDSSLPAVSLEAGDLATFPAGMSCVWDVTEDISKHYYFG